MTEPQSTDARANEAAAPLDPDELPRERVDELARWLHDHNIGICELDDDIVYNDLKSMHALAEQLLRLGPDGIRITSPPATQDAGEPPFRHANGEPCHGCQICLADVLDEEAGEPSAAGPRTLTVTWHPDAIRTAVDRALAILNGDPEAEVFPVSVGFLTVTDLCCLIDAGRQFLTDEAANEGNEIP